MAFAASSSAMRCTGASPSAVESDLLIVPWLEDEDAFSSRVFDEATGGELGRALAANEFAGRLYEIFMTPVTAGTGAAWHPRRIAFVGAGTKAGFDADLVRKIAGAAGLLARQHRMREAAFLLREDIVVASDATEFAQAAAEGLTLSEFNVGAYK